MTSEQVTQHMARAAAGWKTPLKLPTLVSGKTLALSSEPAAKPSKYRNRPTQIDGLTFASKREARRYIELKNMQLAGQIGGLRMQVPIPCVVNGIEVCTYVADFTYCDAAGRLHVEDAKGARTDVYKLKRKLVQACLGVEIVEV